MTYEFVLFRPGIAGFKPKSGEPYGYLPEVTHFEARSHTEALNLAIRMYEETGLRAQGHFNVGVSCD